MSGMSFESIPTLVGNRLAIPMPRISISQVAYPVLVGGKKILKTIKGDSFDREGNKPHTKQTWNTSPDIDRLNFSNTHTIMNLFPEGTRVHFSTLGLEDLSVKTWLTGIQASKFPVSVPTLRPSECLALMMVTVLPARQDTASSTGAAEITPKTSSTFNSKRTSGRMSPLENLGGGRGRRYERGSLLTLPVRTMLMMLNDSPPQALVHREHSSGPSD